MELLKLDERLEEWKHGDVTFYFRPSISGGDKFNLTTAGVLAEDGHVVYKPMELYRALVKIFVTGWDGVTENGKKVPYSYELLSTRFPASDEDMILKLGLYIGQKTGILKTKDEAKEVRERKNG